ncbi:ABC transporter permease [Sphingomonas morindae]|uniref:ABC transporter permease n=1 Tax=Sphingomonas morindae TaxID=1541170 RepID=A0ABY4X635_9SPHN|nr:ABC transporter permease [Sphingomonas morindae]USI72367.1 ABC transporter permease [Sphingomonas morindae]
MITEADRVGQQRGLREAFKVQMQVLGALIMRELHTRYGRDNIGYLWLIGEPLMLGTVIALLHSGQSSHEGDVDPVAFSVVGYSIFIIFRGIVNRAEGSLQGNTPLLYHRMVTVLDVTLARGILELGGTLAAFFVLAFLANLLGFMSLPERPLYLALGIFYVFWLSMGLSMLIAGGTYERPLLERLVHPFTYFMMPLSGAFVRVSWLPETLRKAILWVPMAHMFETIRYGQFASATLEYVDFEYLTAWCLGLSLAGLFAIRTVPARIHLG